ncbi:hypothetical protein AXK11_06185 [Cephaloticoccus primus]|uniref:Antitoxin n=1 Tax=Cephaloticoccus primus TaxID=1548207 RepID=A0A139SLZ2_9BACT|nr:type II toxin-antitoxin system prevent-host-death family antitoxin [Cephaloticoccus primus]KXU35571.1 hypothetical protein AXK11_06185 [Cephaloticoccus primus]
MTKTMTAREAHAQFFEVLDEAQAGAEVIIERDNRPVARLIPFPELNSPASKPTEQRLETIGKLRQWAREAIVGPPLTIEEIISARDEGRRY